MRAVTGELGFAGARAFRNPPRNGVRGGRHEMLGANVQQTRSSCVIAPATSGARSDRSPEALALVSLLLLTQVSCIEYMALPQELVLS
jgi:hypothetical protein